jgi:hypothetical protein
VVASGGSLNASFAVAMLEQLGQIIDVCFLHQVLNISVEKPSAYPPRRHANHLVPGDARLKCAASVSRASS